jgi:hypothetical protein
MAPHQAPTCRFRLIAAASTAVLALAGCTSAGQHDDGGHEGAAAAGALPSRHVHGVTRNRADGHVYLATHDGLFRLAPGTAPVRVGPVIDLMGFTATGPNHFYASGHPGPGTDLPDPVGLIESTDGGHTWTPLSPQGRSDFHTLTASSTGVVGYDGEQLAASSDGRTWQTLTAPVTPHAVAASPDGTTLLVSSDNGLTRSTDAGRTWTPVTTPTPLQLLAFADNTRVSAVGPDGRVATSSDAGISWQSRGSVGGRPHALSATTTPTGREILAVTDRGLLRSADDATTFTPYQP